MKWIATLLIILGIIFIIPLFTVLLTVIKFGLILFFIFWLIGLIRTYLVGKLPGLVIGLVLVYLLMGF